MIKTRNGDIEDPMDLNLNIDKLDFIDVVEVSTNNVNEIDVYDLDVNEMHNYILENAGIVHNGGGKVNL